MGTLPLYLNFKLQDVRTDLPGLEALRVAICREPPVLLPTPPHAVQPHPLLQHSLPQALLVPVWVHGLNIISNVWWFGKHKCDTLNRTILWLKDQKLEYK